MSRHVPHEFESPAFRLGLLILCVFSTATFGSPGGATQVRDAKASRGEVDFAREIRPVLSRACFACHGPDADAREARLRLDLRENALGEDGSFAAIIPGDAEASEVFYRITDEDDPMPPADSGFKLSAEEIELIRRWISEGAAFAQHWAFVSPNEPARPAVADESWCRNDVDRFVLAELESRGWTPAPEADRRTLLRRACLDVTGLPPTPAEVEEFLSDSRADAYEHLIDRLLDSPRYGEHMARFWLDLARYGDTHGLHLDNYREIWPYRDRVIASFNENLPYDEFVVEQLAGDLIPNATLEQQIASGFNRCHVTTGEGGSIEEEVHVRNVVDRVATTGTAFLGLTLGCAACHDHKFDPISTREFYSLFAFFNNVDGAPLDGNKKDHGPVVSVPTGEQAQREAELEEESREREARIAAVVADLVYTEPVDENPAPRELREVVWIDDDWPEGARLEGSATEWVENPPALVRSGRRSMLRQSSGFEQHFFKDADVRLRVGRADRLFAWVRLDPSDPPLEIMLQFNDDGDAGWGHRAFWGEDKIEFGASGTTTRLRLGDLPRAGEWVKLEFPAKDVGLVEGDVIHGFAVSQFGGTSWWDRIGLISSVSQEPEDYVWIDDELPLGAAPSGDGETWNWVRADVLDPFAGQRSLRRSAGDGLSQDFFTGAKPLALRRGDRLFAHVWLDPEDPPRSIQLQFNDGSWDHRVRWGVGAHGAGREGGADHRAGDVPAGGRWTRLEVGLEEVGLKAGAELNGWAFTQVGGTVFWDSAGARGWGSHEDRHLHSLAVWAARAASDMSLPEPVQAALRVAEGERSAEEQEVLRAHYVRHVWSGSRDALDPLEQELEATREALDTLRAEIPTTLVMREREEARPAYVLERGVYDARGEEVPRATPAVLPPMASDLPLDRWGLAQWLVEPNHPLTARVAVNHFWQQLFGAGLVTTSEDFGNQGRPPSHPELLDWLALRFVEDGWDVKCMLRRLLTSATYRQSSRTTPELVMRDPHNRWLARGPRFRLDGETLRDQALALSGLLVDRVGGPPVKPPQPAGLWKTVAYVGSNTDTFVADEGHENVHRRSLYTFFKRTSPPPQFSILDAPNREACRARRERTNTPLQALLLLNDPQYVEAARHLAGRILEEGGRTDRERVRFAFELCTARVPDDEDVEDLLTLLSDQRAEFEEDSAAALALVAVGSTPPPEELDVLDLASWQVVANLILNLDEVLVKR